MNQPLTPPAVQRYTGALPRPTPETAPFWQALAAGRFELPWCLDCGEAHFYPRMVCPHCFSTRLKWRAASGRGQIHTFVINHKPPKGWTGKVPNVLAVV